MFKNITQYSYWSLESLLKINEFENNKQGIKALNKLSNALTLDQFKEYKKVCINRRKDENNELLPFGIPQGSAISAVLSNIYMLEFDKQLSSYVSRFSGKYMRYSDDFIVILPDDGIDVFMTQYAQIMSVVDSTPRLKLAQEKTQIFKFDEIKITNYSEIVLKCVPDGKNIINYLGFSFDGEKVSIRAKTISKYYYRMYRNMCCLNRPYDDQTQQRIQFESVAKLMIQSLIVDGKIDFVWSYVLEFENSKNPFVEKRNTILAFKPYACETVQPNPSIEIMANALQNKSLKAYDSLHVACAAFSGCDYFLTVDRKVLNKHCTEINITDPVIFLNHWLKERSSI